MHGMQYLRPGTKLLKLFIWFNFRKLLWK